MNLALPEFTARMNQRIALSVSLFLMLLLGSTTGSAQSSDDETALLPFADTVESTSPPLRYLITASGPLTFCPGGSVTLTCAGASSNGYLWNTGATTKTILVTQSGTYSVQRTDSKGFITQSYPVTVIVGSIRSDFDLNGTVSINDQAIIVGVFNASCPGCQQDYNGDNFVNTIDYLRFVADFGKNCP